MTIKKLDKKFLKKAKNISISAHQIAFVKNFDPQSKKSFAAGLDFLLRNAGYDHSLDLKVPRK